MTETATSPRRTAARQRRQRAVELRVEGATFDQISIDLGCTRSAAWKMVQREIDEIVRDTRTAAAELRALELARLDSALQAIWSNVEAGHLGAIDRLIRISERRARLLGLDAPSRIAPTDPTGANEYNGGGLSALLAAVDGNDQDHPKGKTTGGLNHERP